jgi:hypothetical protein
LLWQPSGLSATDAEAKAIVAAARAALQELEQDALSPYEIDYSPDRAQVIAERLYAQLQQSIGSDATARVMSWAGALIAARSERDWIQGTFACYELLNDPLNGHALLLLDESDRRKLLQLIHRHLRVPVADEVMREVEQPHTAFDRRQFERLAGSGPPTNALSHLVLRVQYEKVMTSIPQELSPLGSKAFFAWLDQRIATLNKRATL